MEVLPTYIQLIRGQWLPITSTIICFIEYRKIMKVLRFIVALPFLIITLALQVFFLPYAIVAKKREHYPRAKLPTIMFILNVVLGWTVIGWLILLVIAKSLPR